MSDLNGDRPEDQGDGLTARQRRFALEYLADPNGKQAAIRAGYSEKGAEVTASKLLRVPKVAEFLAKEQAKIANRLTLDASYVLRGLKRVAERCQDDETFDAAGANRALELLGKHLKLFTDKVEATGRDGGPLEIRIVDLGADGAKEE